VLNPDHRQASLFLLVVIAPALYMAHLRLSGALDNPFATFQMLLNGTASTPFQYRALAPWVLRNLAWAFDLVPRDFPLLARVWEFISIMGGFLALRAWLRSIEAGALSEAGAFSFFFVFPFLFSSTALSRYYYPSDTLAIVFFTIGLIVLRQRRWLAFAVVFAIATLNRETSLFLLFIDALANWDEKPSRSLILRLAGFGLLWLFLKVGLMDLYAANPGPGLIGAKFAPNPQEALPDRFIASRFYANLLALADLSGLLTFGTVCGFLWLPAVCWWRHIEDRFVRRAQLVAIPFMAIMLVVGNALEMRIYAEMLPVWLAGIVLALVAKGRPPSPRDASSAPQLPPK
jgi:hypothetical protein